MTEPGPQEMQILSVLRRILEAKGKLRHRPAESVGSLKRFDHAEKSIEVGQIARLFVRHLGL